jgi:hypothetical protein
MLDKYSDFLNIYEIFGHEDRFLDGMATKPISRWLEID